MYGGWCWRRHSEPKSNEQFANSVIRVGDQAGVRVPLHLIYIISIYASVAERPKATVCKTVKPSVWIRPDVPRFRSQGVHGRTQHCHCWGGGSLPPETAKVLSRTGLIGKSPRLGRGRCRFDSCVRDQYSGSMAERSCTSLIRKTRMVWLHLFPPSYGPQVLR